MNTQPLISIIIPVYNMESHLGECLDSILNQTYENLEVICVNDGSTDNTLQVIENYVTRDSRVKLLDQKNQGPLFARSNGIKSMSGEYFFFIDADDYLKENAIETLYSQMEKDGTQIAFSNFKLGKKYNFDFKENLLSVDSVLSDVLNCKAKMFPCWGMLISGCYIDYKFKNYRLCEDELYALDLFVDTDKVSFSQDALITYRNKATKSVRNKNFDFYYQGYLAAKDFYDIICKERPNLQTFAECRLLMHTFYCYFNGKKDAETKEKLEQVKNTIKLYRKGVLKNSEASLTMRFLSMLSYLGLGFTSGIFKLYTMIRG